MMGDSVEAELVSPRARARPRARSGVEAAADAGRAAESLTPSVVSLARRRAIQRLEYLPERWEVS